MSQIFWNLVYSLSGVKVGEYPSLFFNFAKFGPGGPKNGHLSFMALFWPFLQFFGLKTFLESEFFYFLIWCFWAYRKIPKVSPGLTFDIGADLAGLHAVVKWCNPCIFVCKIVKFQCFYPILHNFEALLYFVLKTS